jgi:hypothetical protein
LIFSSDAADMHWRLNIDTLFIALRMGSETTMKYILKIRQQCCAADKDIFSIVEKIKFKEPIAKPVALSGSISRLPLDEREKVIYKLYDFYKAQAEPFKTSEISDQFGIDLHIISREGANKQVILLG